MLVVESRAVLTPGEESAVDAYVRAGGRVIAADKPDWLKSVRTAIGGPSITLDGPPTVRAVVHDQPSRTIVHLYNLNVQRLSSYDDRVIPAIGLRLVVRTPLRNVSSVRLQTADGESKSGLLECSTEHDDNGCHVATTVPRLDISAMVVLEP